MAHRSQYNRVVQLAPSAKAASPLRCSAFSSYECLRNHGLLFSSSDTLAHNFNRAMRASGNRGRDTAQHKPFKAVAETGRTNKDTVRIPLFCGLAEFVLWITFPQYTRNLDSCPTQYVERLFRDLFNPGPFLLSIFLKHLAERRNHFS